MPAHKQTKNSIYSSRQIFRLVEDIESYPLFIPWVSGARILSCRENILQARLDIQFKAIRSHYVSRVKLFENHNQDGVYEVNVSLVRGPFKKMVNQWQITPLDDGGCTIDFFVEFVFNSFVLDKAMGLVFDKAVQEMVSCFEHRAALIYGSE